MTYEKIIVSLANGKYITFGVPYTTAKPKLEVADGVLSGVGMEMQETATYGAACDRMATAYQTYGCYEKAEEYFRKAITGKGAGKRPPGHRYSLQQPCGYIFLAGQMR